MKSLLNKSIWAALAVSLFALPSCVVSGGFETVGPPVGDYYVYAGTRYYYPPAYPGYVRRSAAYPYYYGGRYYSYQWWNDNRYRHYRHDYRRDTHHYDRMHDRRDNRSYKRVERREHATPAPRRGLPVPPHHRH